MDVNYMADSDYTIEPFSSGLEIKKNVIYIVNIKTNPDSFKYKVKDPHGEVREDEITLEDLKKSDEAIEAPLDFAKLNTIKIKILEILAKKEHIPSKPESSADALRALKASALQQQHPLPVESKAQNVADLSQNLPFELETFRDLARSLRSDSEFSEDPFDKWLNAWKRKVIYGYNFELVKKHQIIQSQTIYLELKTENLLQYGIQAPDGLKRGEISLQELEARINQLKPEKKVGKKVELFKLQSPLNISQFRDEQVIKAFLEITEKRGDSQKLAEAEPSLELLKELKSLFKGYWGRIKDTRNDYTRYGCLVLDEIRGGYISQPSKISELWVKMAAYLAQTGFIPSNGSKLYLLSQVPENLIAYKNSYIFLQNETQLFYVDEIGEVREERLSNYHCLEESLKSLESCNLIKKASMPSVQDFTENTLILVETSEEKQVYFFNFRRKNLTPISQKKSQECFEVLKNLALNDEPRMAEADEFAKLKPLLERPHLQVRDSELGPCCDLDADDINILITAQGGRAPLSYYQWLIPSLEQYFESMSFSPLTDHPLTRYILKDNGKGLIFLENNAEWQKESGLFQVMTDEGLRPLTLLEQERVRYNQFKAAYLPLLKVTPDLPLSKKVIKYLQDLIIHSAYRRGFANGGDYAPEQYAEADRAYYEFLEKLATLSEDDRERFYRHHVTYFGVRASIESILASAQQGNRCAAITCYRLATLVLDYEPEADFSPIFSKDLPSTEKERGEFANMQYIFSFLKTVSRRRPYREYIDGMTEEEAKRRVLILMASVLTHNFQCFYFSGSEATFLGHKNTLPSPVFKIFALLKDALVVEDRLVRMSKNQLDEIYTLPKEPRCILVDDCELYKYSRLPEELWGHKNCYIFIEEKRLLYHFDKDGYRRDLKLKDYQPLRQGLAGLKSEKTEMGFRYRLRGDEIEKWIVDHGGRPMYKGLYYQGLHDPKPIMITELDEIITKLREKFPENQQGHKPISLDLADEIGELTGYFPKLALLKESTEEGFLSIYSKMMNQIVEPTLTRPGILGSATLYQDTFDWLTSIQNGDLFSVEEFFEPNLILVGLNNYFKTKDSSLQFKVQDSLDTLLKAMNVDSSKSEAEYWLRAFLKNLEPNLKVGILIELKKSTLPSPEEVLQAKIDILIRSIASSFAKEQVKWNEDAYQFATKTLMSHLKKSDIFLIGKEGEISSIKTVKAKLEQPIDALINSSSIPLSEEKKEALRGYVKNFFGKKGRSSYSCSFFAGANPSNPNALAEETNLAMVGFN